MRYTKFMKLNGKNRLLLIIMFFIFIVSTNGVLVTNRALATENSMIAAESMPRVIKVYPSDKSSNISKNTLIYAKFNREMKKSYFNIFTVTLRDEKGDSVFGKIKYVSEKSTVYFIPRHALTSGTAYRLTLKAQIEDVEGKKIPGDYSWIFTVGTKKVVPIASNIDSNIDSNSEIQTGLSKTLSAISDNVRIDKNTKRYNSEQNSNTKSKTKKLVNIVDSKSTDFMKKLNRFHKAESRTRNIQRRIEIDDLLNIRVFNSLGYEEINQDVAVYSDGNITFPMIGTVEVKNLTSKELISKLTKKLEKEYFNNPRVEIRFKGMAAALETIKVYMLGQVKNPGLKDLPLGTRVLDALVSVSGTTENADLSHTRIIRGSEELDIDLKRLVYEGEKIFDVPLKNEDTIFIPAKNKKKQVIYVLGKVRYPARYNFETGMTAIDALSMAEAFSNEFNDVQVIRSENSKQSIIKIDMYKMMREGHTDQDVVLKPGDIVYALNTKRMSREEYIYIFSGDLAYGENSFQGRYNYETGMTLIDSIALLKGIPSHLKWITIVRPKTEPIFVDLRNVIQKGCLDKDVKLLPGDILYFSPIRYRNIVKRFGSFLQRTVVPTLSTLHSVWDSRKF